MEAEALVLDLEAEDFLELDLPPDLPLEAEALVLDADLPLEAEARLAWEVFLPDLVPRLLGVAVAAG